jgi:hypothetical protein
MNQSLRRAAPKISPEGYFGEVQVSAHFFAENSLLRVPRISLFPSGQSDKISQKCRGSKTAAAREF